MNVNHLRRLTKLIILCVVSIAANAQSPYILPSTLSDQIADRWDILYDFDHATFASQRNVGRRDLTKRALHLTQLTDLSKLDKSDIRYILADNNEYVTPISASDQNVRIYDADSIFYYSIEKLQGEQWTEAERKPLLKYFYKSKANFFEIDKKGFSLRANPIINLKFGNGIDDPNTIFQNTRGAEVRGLIDDKVYFYSSILENQARFNNYVERRIKKTTAIPGNAFFKSFQSGVVDKINGYDFLNAQAYVGMNATKSVAVEFGHGKHFIGNGIRSLLLSDYAHNYFYLKFNTKIWKLNYQNIFAELTPVSSRQNVGDFLFPKRYMASHYLNYKPFKNLELGIFESVVFSREDHFEFQYLNPIILYRTVEQFLDSPDNVLIGLNGKWNIGNRFQLYGQLMLDEFKLSEITAGEGWWGNKNGLQAGLKYINVGGIDHLDAQIEYNQVRPYTYAHKDSMVNFPRVSTASYSHFNQPLAHPLGANFSEVVLDLKYRPTAELHFHSRIISAKYGQDGELQNFGGDILIPTPLREQEYGNFIGQGISTSMVSLSLDVSYQFWHNYYFDLHMLYRSADADLDDLDLDTKYVGAGLRANLGNIKLSF